MTKEVVNILGEVNVKIPSKEKLEEEVAIHKIHNHHRYLHRGSMGASSRSETKGSIRVNVTGRTNDDGSRDHLGHLHDSDERGYRSDVLVITKGGEKVVCVHHAMH